MPIYAKNRRWKYAYICKKSKVDIWLNIQKIDGFLPGMDAGWN